MIDAKFKSLITAIALMASFSPACWSQQKVDTVHISQPKSQDLGESCSSNGRGRSGNGSFGSGSGMSSGGANGLGPGYGSGRFGSGSNGSHHNNECCNENNNGSNGSGNGGHHRGGNGPAGFGPGGNHHPGIGGGNPGAGNVTGTTGVIGSCGGNCGGCAGKCGGSTGCGNHVCGCPSHNDNSNNNGGGGGGSSVGDGGGSGLASPQSNQREAMQEFCDPGALGSLDKSWPGGNVAHQNSGQGPEVANKQNTEQIAGQTWPHVLPGFAAQFPPAGQATYKNMPKSLTQGPAAMTPPSASELTTMMTMAQSAMVESLFQPNSWLQTAKEVQNTQTQANADNSANMEKQQAGCAIDFVRSALENFTVDAGNQWNRLRNELFMPMAVLLLLPGAVATQAKATVAQGFSIFGEVSPVEGIYRSIVSIFLIPGTYLIVNYGIDVSNSIAYTIQSEYFRIFGSDMYRDAMCAHIRAFGSRLPSENKGYIPQQAGQMQAQGKGPRAQFEGSNVDVKLEDPCAGIYQAPENKANEKVPYAVNSQRAAYNGMGAALAMTWNILCAFQMCYLYYLWFVGPIMAALWVWPVKQLRDAFPSWCEGVITICFWSLFWNTTILLMACFRGIDDTGTVMMEALNFLSTACVKFAFDFAGLVKAAGAEAGKMAEKAAQGGKGGAAGSRGNAPGASGRQGAPQGNAHPAPGRPPGATGSMVQSSGTLATAGSITNDRAGSISPSINDRTLNVGSGQHTQSSATVSPGSSSTLPPSNGSIDIDKPGSFVGGAATLSNSFTGLGSLDTGLPPKIDPRVDVSGLAGLPGIAGASGQVGFSSNTNEPGARVNADAQREASNQLTRAFGEQMTTDAQAKGQQQQADAQAKLQADVQNQFNSRNAEMLIASMGVGAADSKLPLPGQPLAGEIAAAQTGAKNAFDANITGPGLATNLNLSGTPSQADLGLPGARNLNFDPTNNMNVGSFQQIVANTIDSNANTFSRTASTDPSTGLPLSAAQINFNGTAGPNQVSGYQGIQNTASYPMQALDPNATAASLAQSGQAPAPNIIDVPGNTQKIMVDVPGVSTADSGTNVTRAGLSEDGSYFYAGTNSYTNSDASIIYGAGSLNSSGSGSIERGSVEASAAASELPTGTNPGYLQAPVNTNNEQAQTVYRQQNDTVIEERRPTGKPEPQDQARRALNQNQKYFDQQRINQTRSTQPPVSSTQQGAAAHRTSQQFQRPAGAQQHEEPVNDTQRKADAPLAEQIRYGSILRRSRDTNEMSEEEIELMKKLGNTEENE